MMSEERRQTPQLIVIGSTQRALLRRLLGNHRALLLATLLLVGLVLGTSDAWTSVDPTAAANWTTAPLHVLIYALGLAIVASGALRAPATGADCPADRYEALAGLSHGLRTPLNAVIGFSELMLAEVHGPLGHPKYLDYVRHVSESGTRLAAVTDEILRARELPDAQGRSSEHH